MEEEAERGAPIIYTIDEVLKISLEQIGYSKRQIARSPKKNKARFEQLFGCPPRVCAAIWEELQTTTNEHAFLPQKGRIFRYFLITLHHLKQYPTEQAREALWHVSESWGRKWIQYFLSRIRALKQQKIKWPDNLGDDIWCMTVDGTHFRIEEPRHKKLSQDRRYYSHKTGSAGLNYELGISLSESQLIWMNGPFPAGENDISVFKRHGLYAHLTSTGRKAIGDMGYRGIPEVLSTPNTADKKAVAKFKSRALKRHETFNGMIKTFACMRECFRHGVERFGEHFEAVAVICQYKIEQEQPLFEILIQQVIDLIDEE